MNEHESMGDRGADRAADLDSPGLSPDIMEVENEKYGPLVLRILPLSSGRLAVLYPNGRLHSLVDSWEATIPANAAAQEEYKRTRPDWARPIPPTLTGDDLLKELGL